VGWAGLGWAGGGGDRQIEMEENIGRNTANERATVGSHN